MQPHPIRTSVTSRCACLPSLDGVRSEPRTSGCRWDRRSSRRTVTRRLWPIVLGDDLGRVGRQDTKEEKLCLREVDLPVADGHRATRRVDDDLADPGDLVVPVVPPQKDRPQGAIQLVEVERNPQAVLHREAVSPVRIVGPWLLPVNAMTAISGKSSRADRSLSRSAATSSGRSRSRMSPSTSIRTMPRP
jgi:hypothetical protein